MKIGILETGEVGAELKARFGAYPDMFIRLFGRAAPDLDFHTVQVHGGEMPASIHAAEGWLVTGSRHGAYDDLPWIAPLEAFLCECIAAGVPVAGICFGHQILAQALGGKVEKSGRGWGIGVHHYALTARPEWMADLSQTFAMRAMHQDQVTELPEGAHVLAASEHCPYAALAYGALEAPDAISIQPHPEFEADYVDALIAGRTGTVFPAAMAGAARATLAAPVDDLAWARLIADFFRQARERSSRAPDAAR